MTALVQHNHLSPKIGWETYGTIFAMFLFTLFEFGLQGADLPGILVLGISSINYLLILVLYVGIAMLAYKGHTWLLWGSGLAVYIIGYMFTGLDSVWTMFSEWSMILFGGAVVGRLTAKSIKTEKVYTIGMVAVLLFALSMFLPLLTIKNSEITKMITIMIENANSTSSLTGYTAEELASIDTILNKMLSIFVHILPAMLLLGAVFQYSIGYLVFMYLMSRKDFSISRVAPFTMWKMPFYMTVIILFGACMRFFGNELFIQVGDNILVFLAIYYSISGLSLMEYYLTKLKFPPFIKFSFYLLLFFTQLIGFFIAIFIGFVDSFKDFRDTEQLNLQNE